MATMRPCPMCGESIRSDAYYCKHCHQNLPAADAASITAARSGPLDSDWYCLQCGQFGSPRTITKGSFLIEIFLWLMLIVPGVIYSLWRLTSKFKGCRFCGSTSLVPPTSPKAREARAAIERQPTS